MSILNIIAVPDVHVPFHDRRAWELALKIVEGVQPEYVVHLGDLGDMNAVAQHPKKYGRKRAWAEEKRNIRAAVRELVVASASRRLKRRAWLQGNHEESYERYVANNAEQLEEDVPSGRELIGVPMEDLWVPYRSHVDIGKVTFAHDIGHSGVNATMQNLRSAGRNIVTGHTHRAGLEWGGNTHGDGHFSLSCGWLGDKSKIMYLTQTQTKDWRLGIGLIQLDSATGFVWPVFVPFVNYTAIVLGKQYKVKS